MDKSTLLIFMVSIATIVTCLRVRTAKKEQIMRGFKRYS